MRDRGLLLKGAEGDNRAIRELWEIWYPRLKLYYKGSVPEKDVEDLIQESMLKVFRNLSTYNPIYSPSTWIYTIAFRTRTDWLRKESKRPLLKAVNDKEDIVETVPGRYPDPETEYLNSESKSDVKSFLESRDKRDREILYLYCYEDLSGRAIAGIMDLPPETVRYRLKILKQKLKEELLQ